jgi:hypothetical protein
MSYQVGVDVGGTFTTAAVVRRGRAEVVSVVPTQLPGVPRGFLNRVGDDTPVLVGTRAVPAETLVAQLVAHVVSTIGTPATLAVTHPVTWGPHRVAALRAALGEVTMLSTAAAVAYQSEYPTAVHDLGGSTFTAAVVRGLATVGQPVELDLGGADLDELVFDHVQAAAGDDWPSDPAALSRLRQACTAAKETLSADTEAEISVGGTRVRLTRAEFEEMARPLLSETAVAFRMMIEESGITPATVLLAGGAAWLPLLTQVVSEELGRPVTATPPGAAAMGAALAVAGIGPTSAARPAGVPAHPANQNQAGPAGLPAALRPATPSAVGLSAASDGTPAFARPTNQNRGDAFTAAGTGPAPTARQSAATEGRANRPGAAGPGAGGAAGQGRGDAPFAAGGPGPAMRSGRVDSPTRLAVSLDPTGFSGEVRTTVVEPVRPPVPSADAPTGTKPKRSRTMIVAAAAGFVVIGAAAGIALSNGQTPAGAGAETMPTTTTVTSIVSLSTTTKVTPPQTVPQQTPPPKRQTTTTQRPPTTTTPQPTTTPTTSAPTTTTTTSAPTSARSPENDEGGDS